MWMVWKSRYLTCEVDIEADSVLPTTARIRAVGDNVAATVVLACQKVNREKKGKDLDRWTT